MKKLIKREQDGNPVSIGIVGAGQMGRGMTAQLTVSKGMRPSVLADINVENAINAFKGAGLSEGDFVVTNKLSEANDALKKGKFVATEDSAIAINADAVDVVVDATGIPNVGAKVAYDSIMNKKHIVLLTVETDVAVGPILNRLAENAGVVYTGTAGDEPGVVKEMFDWATAMSFEVRAAGKGPNNALNFYCNPDDTREEAISRGMNPKMLCSFKDNTKTAVELTAISNATGLISDIPGAHGGKMPPKDIPKYLSLKEEGGVLNNYGVVEYIDGIQPGVFIMISSPLEEVQAELRYLKLGEGPNFLLHKPYHLVSLETPLSAAKAVIDNIATIKPSCGMVSEVVTKAKRDIKAGEYLDGIGGFTVRGIIDSYQSAKAQRALPISLINNKTRALRDIKKDEVITYDMVSIDETAFIYQLRKMQESLFG